MPVDSATSQYQSMLSKLLEKDAPPQEGKKITRAKAPWYDSDDSWSKTFSDKTKKQNAQNQIRNYDYDFSKDLCISVNSCILDSEKTYYNDKIDNGAGARWTSLNHL